MKKQTIQEMQRKINCFKHRVTTLPAQVAALQSECSFLAAIAKKPEHQAKIADIVSELTTLQAKTTQAMQVFID